TTFLPLPSPILPGVDPSGPVAMTTQSVAYSPRCNHARDTMTAQILAPPSDISKLGSLALAGRRMWLWPAILAVVGALVSGTISFAILTGLTSIRPDESVTLTLIAINAAFVLLLTVLILREAGRIYLARRRGKAASRLHVRIVTLFSLVAAIPALMIAVVASVTLDVGLDSWFE